MKIGAMLMTTIWQAALTEQDIPEDERRNLYLAVDETHSFATASVADMLAETRKYRLNLTLAHQYLDQLEFALHQPCWAMWVRSLPSAPEQRMRHISPGSSTRSRGVDFVNLPQYHIYMKLLIDGVPSKGFSAVTLPFQGTKTGNAAQVIELSRARYGRAAPPVNASAATHQLPACWGKSA